MKTKKGISLIVLAVTIVIMIILVTTVTITGISVLNNSNKIKFATELSYMQEMVDSYRTNNSGEYPVKDSIQIDLNSIQTEFLDQFDGETKTNENKIVVYEIDKTKIGKNETIYGNKSSGENDVYAVSKETNRVYYVKGKAIDDKIFYTLTEELKKSIGYIDNSNNIVKDNISFTPSTTNYTNSPVEVTVKIPEEYIATVLVKQANLQDITIPINSTDTANNIYVISGISNNYNIEVVYKKPNSNVDNTQTYSVTCFDNQEPTITLSNQNNVNDGTNVYAYFNLTASTDNLSGIKYIKYEDSEIKQQDAKSYFQNSSKVVINNVIELKRPAKYLTIYALDNAGNEFYKLITLQNPGYNEMSYIKDGLVLNLDGKNNTGNGHSNIATSWKDLSGKKGEATLIEMPSNCWQDDAIIFNGTSGYVNLNKVYLPEYDDFTVEIITSMNQYESSNVAQFIVSQSGNVVGRTGLAFESDNIQIFNCDQNRGAIPTDYIKSGFKPAINEKFNAIMMKKDNIKIGINGYIKATQTISNRLICQTNTILGRYGWASPYLYYNGKVYSVRIYNRALSDNELQYNYMIDKLRFGI